MTPAAFEAIRSVYKRHMPDIMAASKLKRRVNPYFIDWVTMFTPIERAAWNSIRAIGVPLYPQIPVLNYFLDFGNPYLKIGLELDGKQFHCREKDKIRDQRLYDEAGWKVFRVTGREASIDFKTPDEFEAWEVDGDEYNRAVSKWLNETADGIIYSIDRIYFRNDIDAYQGQCLGTLYCHRLVFDYDLLIPGGQE